MNIKNLKRLRKKLSELSNFEFNMSEYENECGTVRCVAGWTRAWFGHETTSNFGYLTIFDEFLDIDATDSKTTLWICGYKWHKNFNSVEHAIKRIDYLIEHGSAPADYDYDDDAYHNGEKEF